MDWFIYGCPDLQSWARIFKLLRSPRINSASLAGRSPNFKRLWSPGIDSKVSIPQAYVAWRACAITLFLLSVPSPIDSLKIPALISRSFAWTNDDLVGSRCKRHGTRASLSPPKAQPCAQRRIRKRRVKSDPVWVKSFSISGAKVYM
jgi:hypothetical protein